MSSGRHFMRSLALSLLVAACANQSKPAADEDPAVAFAPCSLDGDDLHFESAATRLSSVDRWLQLTKNPTVEVRPEDEGNHSLIVTVMAMEASVGKANTTADQYRLTIHDSYLPGIEWALASGGQAYVATELSGQSGESASFVLVETADGNHFFPGDCQYLALTSPLRSELGSSFDDVVGSMIGMENPSTLLKNLSGSESPSSGVDQVLNPEDAPPGLLESLGQVSLVLDIPSGWESDNTLCSRIEEGWNDCVALDNLDRPLQVDAYFNESLLLELWVLDASATLSSPVQHVASLDLKSVENAALTKGAVVRVSLSGSWTDSEAEPVSDPGSRIVDYTTWEYLIQHPEEYESFTGEQLGTGEEPDQESAAG